MTIDDVLAQVRIRLDLEAECEHELLEEIRGHLEDAVADARLHGLDEQHAIIEAAQRFGIQPAADALKRAHAGKGALDGILAAALPVVGVLVLRWMIFAPDGTFGGWRQTLARPAFWVVALVCLIVPLIRFERRRLALAGWALFWGISLVMALGSAVRW